MGGWLPFGASSSYQNTDTNSAGYGTRTPNVSDQYTKAFGDYKASLNPAGYNPVQQKGVDSLNALSAARPVNTAMRNVNTTLFNSSLAQNKFINQDPRQLGANPTVAAERINAKTGADYMDQYKDPYEKDVLDATMTDYDANTAASMAKLRGANAGAFGNKRFGVAESNFLDASGRGRATLGSNIRSQGFQLRTGLGQSDADRALSGDTSNASNFLRASEDNASMSDSRERFNVDSAYKNDEQARAALKDQAGLTQQMMDNVVTSNGIDLEVAQSLFAAGSISQSQLNDIINIAGAYNGSSYTDNKTGGTTQVGVSAHVGS